MKKQKNKILIVCALMFFFSGCNKNMSGDVSAAVANNDSQSQGENPIESSPSSDDSSSEKSSYVPMWEKGHSDRKYWSDAVRNVVENKADALYKGSNDIQSFCPKYWNLGKQDRLNFWVEFFAGVAYYESGHNPLNRYTEAAMGIDAVTGRQVVSEGLLQLSYQDSRWHSYCEFNYSADRKYANNDIRRTILNPAKNLSCGIQILNTQVRNRGNIALSSGVYWSVLKVGGRYSKLSQIRSITKALSFCK